MFIHLAIVVTRNTFDGFKMGTRPLCDAQGRVPLSREKDKVTCPQCKEKMSE